MTRLTLLCFSIFSLMTSQAIARDTKHMFSLQEAMNSPDAKEKLGDDIQFFFGDTKTPEVETSYGEYQSNKKTNAFNKSDKEACMWVFLSAMISLENRARELGANAVKNIRSYYKKNLISSKTQFECGAGALMAGVTLKGEMVKLKGPKAKPAAKNSKKAKTIRETKKEEKTEDIKMNKEDKNKKADKKE